MEPGDADESVMARTQKRVRDREVLESALCFGLAGAHVEGVFDQSEQFVIPRRFFEHRQGADAHGPRARRQVPVPGDHNRRYRVFALPNLTQDFEPVAAGQANVEHEALGAVVTRFAEEISARRKNPRLEPCRNEQRPKRVAHRVIVVDDEHRPSALGIDERVLRTPRTNSI